MSRQVELSSGIITPPGTMLARDAYGKPYFVPVTATLLTQQRELEAQAGLATSKPLGDHASFADYLRSGEARTQQGLMRFATRHQTSPQKTIALELEARQRGTFEDEEDARKGGNYPGDTGYDEDEEVDDDESAMTFPSGVRGKGRVLPFEALKHLRVSEGATLQHLIKQRVIHPSMSHEEVSARLKACGLSEPSRMRVAVQASDAGWPVPGSRNGSTLQPYRNVPNMPDPLHELQASLARYLRHVGQARRSKHTRRH